MIFEQFLYNKPPNYFAEFKRIFAFLSPDEWNALLDARRILFNEDNCFLKYFTAKITSENQPYKISMLNISGTDLKRIGYTGKQLGIEFNRLLDACLYSPEKNKKDELIKLAIDDFKQSLY